MPFIGKERLHWEHYFRDTLGEQFCAICGGEVIWDRQKAPAHGAAGTISDYAANIDHIIASKDECQKQGINYNSKENLRVTHRKCNYQKNDRVDKTPDFYTYNGPMLPLR